MKTYTLQEKKRSSSLDKVQSYLLSQKINDLELPILGTRLDELIKKLYVELENAGIFFKPKTYLSDGWGCPQNVPVIGIPFYLTNPDLLKLEEKMTGIKAITDHEILMYLRHETGHAFNYAYRLYNLNEWQRIFGKYCQPYREEYSTSPFSAHFVRHMPGWYAQKHPDEDFAESFAVWLTPNSNWKRVYARTGALKKLLYVDRIARRFGRKPSNIMVTKLDKPVQELTMTLRDWYETKSSVKKVRPKLNNIIDEDLRRLFTAKRGRSAADILQANQSLLIREVNYWTGLDRHILTSLFIELLEEVSQLDLKIESKQTTVGLASISIFLATLATNYQISGQFMAE